MSKKLMSRPWVQEILAFLGVLYIEAVRYSIRWEVRNNEYIENVLDNDTPILGVVWHGRILMALQGWYRKRDRMVALASRSREGDLGSRLARWYNVVLVRGSSHNKSKPEKFKGGSVAYREMMRLIGDGMSGVITPDGPRGPRMRAGYGAVRMARDTGVPIVPFTWSTRRKTVLTKSWDRHCLPHFFTKGVIIWGDPIHVAPDASQEELDAARQLLEERMIAITREADEAVGAEVIEPDEEKRPRTGTEGAPA
ncbi:lysophospholipid acyltransferase family protein [Maricaulis sp.]|uniref:lysophospholipid acyltransferase family protein n=1 Tax=Maricaulis sp. TaxID=1486257 RepID=UPI00261290D4|nr:lysophospholipid acyltransferase family protein [Maricaulis sp.]